MDEVNRLIRGKIMGHAHGMASLNVGFSREIPADFEPPEGLAPIVAFEDFQEASEAGLGILAMGNPYWTFLYNDRYVICVSDQIAEAALKEVSKIAMLKAREAKPHPVLEMPEHSSGAPSVLLYLLILVGCFVWKSSSAIVEAGRLDSAAILAGGEWWRAITALTLHSDIVHLASNIVGGAGFAFLLTRFFGSALAWLLILVAGVAGNLINAAVHYPEAHLSIGASTAVFGALGLLTGVGIWFSVIELRAQRRWLFPQWMIPAFGGFTLLSLLGAGEGRIDVGAHISGFGCGLILGLLAAWRYVWLEGLGRFRLLIAGLPIVLLVVAWWAALLTA
ncbi:MAG: rhomboid family intramembrane serine protease [Verrucomicrobiota bacterium]